jgi:hypothetical protein
MHTTDAAGGVAHIHHHYRSLGHRYVSMAVEACVACPNLVLTRADLLHVRLTAAQ